MVSSSIDLACSKLLQRTGAIDRHTTRLIFSRETPNKTHFISGSGVMTYVGLFLCARTLLAMPRPDSSSDMAARVLSPLVRSWTQSKSLQRCILINDRILAAITGGVLFFVCLHKTSPSGSTSSSRNGGFFMNMRSTAGNCCTFVTREAGVDTRLLCTLLWYPLSADSISIPDILLCDITVGHASIERIDGRMRRYVSKTVKAICS
jgi:hypothetical protein